jgi:hypothetical protein
MLAGLGRAIVGLALPATACDARRLAVQGDDTPVWPETANAVDDEWVC